MDTENTRGKRQQKVKWETHELLPGEKPVGHELPGSDSYSLVRHVGR